MHRQLTMPVTKDTLGNQYDYARSYNIVDHFDKPFGSLFYRVKICSLDQVQILYRKYCKHAKVIITKEALVLSFAYLNLPVVIIL